MVSISVRGGGVNGLDCIRCPARSRMLCSGLSDDLLPALSSISTQITLEKGETLFYEGDEARFAYNIMTGFLRLSRISYDGKRQVLGFLTTGDFLGHTSKPLHTLSAEALTDVHVCRYDRIELERLLQNIPSLERQFYQMTAGLLDDMLELVFTLGRKNALERVASFIVHFCDRQSPSDQLPAAIKLPMTRTDIADFLGLTLETVSRAFSKLKRDGIIEIELAHSIRILDRSGLIDLTAGDMHLAAQ